MIRSHCTAALFVLALLSHFPVFSQVPIPSAGGTAMNDIIGGGGGPSAAFQSVRDFAVVGNYAYATSGHGMVGVIDVSTPHSPMTKGFISHNPLGAALSGASGIAVQGNYAFVAASQSHALEIIDVSNPTMLVHAGKILDGAGGAELSNARDVAVVGNNAFVVGNNTGGEVYMEVVDVTNKTTPLHVAKVDIKHSSGFPAMFGQPLSITVVGNYAYVGSTSQLAVMNISTPSAPTFVTVLDNNDTNGPYLSFINNIAVKDNYLYLPAANQSGMEVLDISNPAAPTHAAFFANDSGGEAIISQPSTVSVSGNYAYIVSESSYVEIADISNPLVPTHAATYTPAGGSTFTGAFSSAVVGNICYLGTQLYFETIYIFDPAPPRSLNTNSVAQTSFNVIWNDSPAFSGYELDISADNFSTYLPGYNAKQLPAGTTQEAVTGLTATTTYNIRLRALNANGESDNATFIAHTLPTAVSASVTTVTADSYTVSWAAIPGADYYEYAYSEDPELFENAQLQFTVTTSATVTQQLPGRQFYFIVRAKNGGGAGPFVQVPVLTLPLPPSFDPSNKFSQITQTSFKANWILFPMVQSSLRIDVATDNAFTNMVTGYNDLTLPISNSVVVENLQPNTIYYVRLRSVNSGGPSAHSATESLVTMPAAMTALDASAIAQSSFTARWTEVPGVSKYFLDVSSLSDFSVMLSTFNNRQIDAPNSQLLVDGLTPGTTYYYRVRCSNASGISPNSNVISQITVPPTPTQATPSITAVGPTAFTANWMASTGATGYFVDVKNQAGSFVTGYENASVTTGTSLVVDSGLTPGTSYNFVVRAANSAGVSPSSVAFPALTSPAVPTALPGELNSANSFTAKWQSVAGATKYLINVSTDPSFAASSLLGGYNPFDAGNSTSTTVTVNVQAKEGGVFYYQVAARNDGGTSPFSSAVSISFPVTSFDPLNLPTGGQVTSYVIISVPDGTIAATTLADESFGKTWRVMHYNNETDANVDVPKVSDMQAGLGYWVNTNLDEASPSITITGQAVPSTKTLTLQKGWNQIGNPFNFGISWADVKAKNPSVAGVGDLYTYSGGFAMSDALKGYGGGFVQADNAVQLTIPTTIARATGRTVQRRHEIEDRDIAGDAWFLPIQLETGGRVQDLAGVGMHPQALTTKDRFDAVALPRLFDMADISTRHPEFFLPRFMTDVVGTADAYTWTFDIAGGASTGEARIMWDNSQWTGGKLYLIDDSNGMLLDMQKSDTYSFDPRRTRSIKFAYGRNGQITTDITSLGQPFPNPSSDRVTFPLISTGETINVTVLDLTGRTVSTMAMQNTKAGYNEIVWDVSERRLAPGVYVYHFTTSNGIRKTGRIVLK